jgi:hypothetical protein
METPSEFQYISRPDASNGRIPFKLSQELAFAQGGTNWGKTVRLREIEVMEHRDLLAWTYPSPDTLPCDQMRSRGNDGSRQQLCGK